MFVEMFKPLFFSTHCHRKHSHKDIFTFFCFLSEDICKIGAAVAGLGNIIAKNLTTASDENIQMWKCFNEKTSKYPNNQIFICSNFKVINTRTWYSNTQVLKDWNIPMLLENSLPHWQLARRCKLRPEPVGWEWGWQQQQQRQQYCYCCCW